MYFHISEGLHFFIIIITYKALIFVVIIKDFLRWWLFVSRYH